MVKKLYFVSFPLKRKAESSQIDLFVDFYMISSVVIALFTSASLGGNVRIAITILFIGAMLLLTLGLMFFLREIYLSTRYLRIGEPKSEHSPAAEIVTTADADRY
jgi:hypothetical protein